VYARAVDQADARLRELRQEERGELGVAGAALTASVVATQLIPALAAPLFVGGLVVGLRGTRAMWLRWDLLERLSRERDAHVISEVRAFATREATMERRHSFAALVRGRLAAEDPRLLAVADELGALASELEDDHLALDPVAAVACTRLLSEVSESPLLNPALPTEDLRSRVRQIRAGFTRRSGYEYADADREPGGGVLPPGSR
jgi:hypothetical protein